MEYKLFDLSEVNGWVGGLEENGLELVAKTNTVVEICDNYKIGDRYYNVGFIDHVKGEVGVHEIKFKDVSEIKVLQERKEFYGEVSLVARIHFMLEAESEEEAKEKIFNSDCPISMVDDNGKEVCKIHGIDWHLVDKARQGNVREPDLDDLYIEESEV